MRYSPLCRPGASLRSPPLQAPPAPLAPPRSATARSPGEPGPAPEHGVPRGHQLMERVVRPQDAAVHRRPLVHPLPERVVPPHPQPGLSRPGLRRRLGGHLHRHPPLPQQGQLDRHGVPLRDVRPHLPLPGGAVHHHAIEPQRTGVGEGRPQAGHLLSLHPHHRLVHRPWSPLHVEPHLRPAPRRGRPAGGQDERLAHRLSRPDPRRPLVPAPAGEGLRPVHPRHQQPRQERAPHHPRSPGQPA